MCRVDWKRLGRRKSSGIIIIYISNDFSDISTSAQRRFRIGDLTRDFSREVEAGAIKTLGR